MGSARMPSGGGACANIGFAYMWSDPGTMSSNDGITTHQGFFRMDLSSPAFRYFESGDVVKVHSSVQSDPPTVAEIISLFHRHGDANIAGHSSMLCVLRWFVHKKEGCGYVGAMIVHWDLS